MEGWKGGGMEGWKDGRKEGKGGVRIAYNNQQKSLVTEWMGGYMDGWNKIKI